VRRIEKLVTVTADALAVTGLAILLILATFTLLDGLLRALANTPIDLVREIGDLVAAICGACCLPIALLHRNNIVLRALESALPAFAVRIVDVFASLIIEACMIGMAWQFYLFGFKTLRAGDVTWLLNWPKAPFWFVVDAILWVGVAVQTFMLIEDVTGTAKKRSSELVS